MNEKLAQNQSSRIYVKKVWTGKVKDAFIGPVHHNNIRTIFAVGSGSYELADVNIETGELINTCGDENYSDAQQVMAKL